MKLPDNTAFIGCSDLHVDEFAWTDRPKISGDSKHAFSWIVDLASENNVPILAAGDLLERQANKSDVPGFLRRELKRLTGHAAFMFTQGQHDLLPQPWLRAVSDDTIWLADHASDEEGRDVPRWLQKEVDGPVLKVWGIDWTPMSKLPEELARIPKDTDVLVLHQVCHEFMGSITIPELTLRAVPHAKLVLIGDYHKHVQLKLTGATGQQLTVLSPGSSNMRAINEPPEKYVYAVGYDLSYTSIRIPTRPLWTTSVASEEMLDEVVTKIGSNLDKAALTAARSGVPDALCKPLVFIRFDPEIPIALQRLENAVGDKGHLFTQDLKFKVADDAEQITNDEPQFLEGEELGGIDEEINPLVLLPEAVSRDEEPEVFDLVHRLLTETDDAKVLSEERAKCIRD